MSIVNLSRHSTSEVLVHHYGLVEPTVFSSLFSLSMI